MDTDEYQYPKRTKKFRTNFIKLLEQKAAATIQTDNRFEAISESESETEIETSTNKVKDGSTDNHSNLTKDLKGIIKGKYSVKYTNATTIIFTENEEDYNTLLGSIKEAEIPHHTYTSKADKTHAFVLRGMANGTEKQDIVEDLRETYEIKTKEIYLMSTKYRPLYLVVTDPAITLEYLNKNVRVIENTKISWEIRKSIKTIIQCHRCQACKLWPPPKVLKMCRRPPNHHLHQIPRYTRHVRQLPRGTLGKLHEV
ncbi:unnamed protein product [Psylliodes chrysocephalus]|uniref:Uncharacterized protein n=1 Tax=Psylliodes chrysocephalus TaxID=3402493 RepID=A0A9P0D4V3_9CUCU|nr:unnamed protein product [Psylliodes chrysocephala]